MSYESNVGGVVALQVTDVRLEQPSKADYPIRVTLLPIVTEVKPEQP